MEDQHWLRGNLRQIRFPDLLLKISDRKQTGVLRLIRKPFQKVVYFQEGMIVFARSSDPDERLGELLLRQNKVTYRQLVDCFDKVGPGMRLGTVLVLQGYITPNDLYIGVIDQVKGILYQLFEWEEAEYEFTPGKLPTVEVITLNISTPDLVMDGIDRIDRWSWIREAIVSLDAVFRKREGWMAAAKQMTMTPIVKALIDLLDVPRTLEEILQLSTVGNFETCRILWTFRSVGIADQILVAPVAPLTQEPTLSLPAHAHSPLESPGETTTAKMFVQDLPPQLQMPSAAAGPDGSMTSVPELSFADLADLTDKEVKSTVGSSVPHAETWEAIVPRHVKDFNEIHRYLFEMLRLEIGDLAVNHVKKIFRQCSTRFPFVFDGLHANEFGEFNESSLVANIRGNLYEEYRDAFEYLLTQEKDLMVSILDKKIVGGIEAGLKRIEQRQQSRDQV